MKLSRLEQLNNQLLHQLKQYLAEMISHAKSIKDKVRAEQLAEYDKTLGQY